MRDFNLLRQNDPEVYAAVMDEANRQRNKIELIASENFVSNAVIEAIIRYVQILFIPQIYEMF